MVLVFVGDEEEIKGVGEAFGTVEVEVYAEGGVGGFDDVAHVVEVPECEAAGDGEVVDFIDGVVGGLAEVGEGGGVVMG